MSGDVLDEWDVWVSEAPTPKEAARAELIGNVLPHKQTEKDLERYAFHKADRRARRQLDDEEAAAARGPRTKRTAAEFAKVEPAPVIMDNVLAAEMNLLGGPSEAGKSLLARDWSLAVGSGLAWRGHAVRESRNVLWIASEGLHDFAERWSGREGWDEAQERIYVLDEAVNLVSGDDVDWLLSEYAEEKPGLVVFDVVYGMGMADDMGTRDVFPVIKSLKRISEAWGAATLALGHPGLNGDRRFRGSSSWRQLTYTEWHLSDGRLTCEKSKIGDKRRLTQAYRTEYPDLVWLSTMEDVADKAKRYGVIAEDIRQRPNDSNTQRAERLASVVDLSEERTRKLVAEVKNALKGPK